MNPAVGIDLGTTNTVVAVQTDETGPVILEIPQPAVQRSVLESHPQIKSAVYFESASSAVVGTFAADRLDAIRSIKSRMGTRWRASHPFDDETILTPAYVSAHILKVAYKELVRRFPGWDRCALVTVPASFSTDQRRDTLSAATMAGFSAVQLLDEPTAAFYSFFDQNRHSFSAGQPQTVLVFDFGGGTLDVSIIRVSVAGPGIHLDTIGRSRYNNLGGDDIDLDLGAFLLALWLRDSSSSLKDVDRRFRRDLCQLFRNSASAFKEEVEEYFQQGLELNECLVASDLSAADTTLRVALRRQLSREQYEEVTGRFFTQKNELNIFRPIRQAIDVADEITGKFTQLDLDFVLYTGGASRMAGVRSALEAYLAPARCYSISHEDACNTVALGAASCRFDEMVGTRGVTLTARLLESVLARDEETSRYIPLLPLTSQPAENFELVNYEFKTLRPSITVRVPLLRGSGPDDHNLAPMADAVFKLPKVINEGVGYRLLYRLTSDKTVQLRAEFPSEQLIVTANVDVDGSVKGTDDPPSTLMSVNET